MIKVDCFCPRCLGEFQAVLPGPCPDCRRPLAAKFDGSGEFTRDYYKAFCCDAGCKNCPYAPGQARQPAAA